MFTELKERLSCNILSKDNELYDEKRKVWNGAINKYPGAIVVCQSEEDVVTAVKFANEKGLSITARGGGHHLAGTAVCDNGIMIDLSEMKQVIVDEEKCIAYVEGGATLGDIDAETQKFGLAVPTGTVSETGVAGLALSGGMGYLRGKYGLTLDNIIGANIVTAAGQLLSINEENHKELFWAIRGGGGNFGIVTKFIFKLHSVGPEVLAADVMYDYQDARQILKKAQAFLNNAPDEVSFNLLAAELPKAPFLPEALHYKKVVMLSGMYSGDPKDGGEAIQPLRELATPIADQSGITTYIELQKKFDPMVINHVPVFGTSLYFGELNDQLINRLLELMESAPAPTAMLHLWPTNGEMNKVPADKTAFAIRDAQYGMLLEIIGLGVDVELCKKWIDHAYNTLLPLSHRNSSYLNGIEVNDFATRNSLASNYDALLKIKKKYDPTNIFRHNHNIDPEQ